MSRAPRVHGRGKHYHRWRALTEAVLQRLYAGGWPARVWGALGPGRRLEVLRHRVGGLPAAAGRRPLRVAFASDLHLGPTTPVPLLERAFDELAAAEPDVLVLGGDYVFLDATPGKLELLARLLARVRTSLKFGVLGNHDLWADHPALERALAAAGVRVLVNDAVRLPPPWDDVAVAGVDEPWTGTPDAARVLRACGDAPVMILAAHSSDALSLTDLSARPPALLLSGHTHGGQIALPGGRPIVLPPGETCRRFPAGLFQLASGTHLFVSRGLGNTEVALRVSAPPDVAIIELVESTAAAAAAA